MILSGYHWTEDAAGMVWGWQAPKNQSFMTSPIPLWKDSDVQSIMRFYDINPLISIMQSQKVKIKASELEPWLGRWKLPSAQSAKFPSAWEALRA